METGRGCMPVGVVNVGDAWLTIEPHDIVGGDLHHPPSLQNMHFTKLQCEQLLLILSFSDFEFGTEDLDSFVSIGRRNLR